MSQSAPPAQEFTLGEIISLVQYQHGDLRRDALAELSNHCRCSEESLLAANSEGDFSGLPVGVRSIAPAAFSPVLEPNFLERARVALSVSRHFSKKTMLDYGGAAGWHSIAFSRLGLAVTYFEPRADLADFASWRFQARNLTISQDFNPVASGRRFDIICCFDFLPVVPDPVGVVAELHSLLNQDGILFLTPGLQPTNGLATDAIAMLTVLGLRRAISVGYMDVFVRDAPVYHSIEPLTVKEEACAVLRRRMSLMPAA